MTGSDFIFDSFQLMYYKCQKLNFTLSGSYIDPSEWITRKKSKINLKSIDDKCFQYAATVALNYEEVKCSHKRVLNIELLRNKYNWKGINYLSKTDNWKMFKKNYPTIALNVL